VLRTYSKKKLSKGNEGSSRKEKHGNTLKKSISGNENSGAKAQKTKKGELKKHQVNSQSTNKLVTAQDLSNQAWLSPTSLTKRVNSNTSSPFVKKDLSKKKKKKITKTIDQEETMENIKDASKTFKFDKLGSSIMTPTEQDSHENSLYKSLKAKPHSRNSLSKPNKKDMGKSINVSQALSPKPIDLKGGVVQGLKMRNRNLSHTETKSKVDVITLIVSPNRTNSITTGK